MPIVLGQGPTYNFFFDIIWNNCVKCLNINQLFVCKKMMFVKRNTVGDGSCVIHSIFGLYNKERDAYFKTDAAQIRKDLQNILGQYSSAFDPNMPDWLKRCLFVDNLPRIYELNFTREEKLLCGLINEKGTPVSELQQESYEKAWKLYIKKLGTSFLSQDEIQLLSIISQKNIIILMERELDKINSFLMNNSKLPSEFWWEFSFECYLPNEEKFKSITQNITLNNVWKNNSNSEKTVCVVHESAHMSRLETRASSLIQKILARAEIHRKFEANEIDSAEVPDNSVHQKSAEEIKGDEISTLEKLDINSQDSANKSTLIKIINKLIENIEQKKGGRWTSGRGSDKVRRFIAIRHEIEGSDKPIDFEVFLKKIRTCCSDKRNALHFWAIPESVREFEDLIKKEELSNTIGSQSESRQNSLKTSCF